MPSMSFGESPQSRIALSAASAWRPICDKLVMRPNSVVSAAPTMAIDFGFMLSAFRRLAFRGPEQGERYLVVDLLESYFELHVELEGLGGLRALDDVRHHPQPLVEFNNRDRVGRREARHRPVMDHVAVEPAPAGRLEHADLARRAMRAERPRREIGLAAGVATLQPQFARARAFPEMHGLGRRLRPRALSLRHGEIPQVDAESRLLPALLYGKRNLHSHRRRR